MRIFNRLPNNKTPPLARREGEFFFKFRPSRLVNDSSRRRGSAAMRMPTTDKGGLNPFFISPRAPGSSLKSAGTIIASYRTYISKYAGKDQSLVKRVFDAIPSELGKQDKRFVLSNLEHGASRRKYGDPTQWLIDAGMAYYSFNTTAFELPFEATENRKLYKLYSVDTGLLSCMLLKNLQFSVMNGAISVNEGALAENFVACQLSAKSIPLHYYDKKSKQELDFIIEEDNAISILEVKSGQSFQHHASLNAALSAYADKIKRSVVLCTSNIFVQGDVCYMPIYMAMFM